jgi:hypothetical protein
MPSIGPADSLRTLLDAYLLTVIPAFLLILDPVHAVVDIMPGADIIIAVSCDGVIRAPALPVHSAVAVLAALACLVRDWRQVARAGQWNIAAPLYFA